MIDLKLPFKPFTLNEVKAITGITVNALDGLLKHGLQLQHGSGETGLEFVQTFGVFVYWRYLEEGADFDRAAGVMSLVLSLTPEAIEKEFSEGRTFPVPSRLMKELPGKGILVEAPDSPLGNRLNLKALLAEFSDRLDRYFKNSPSAN